MCGIAGIVSPSGVKPETLVAMTNLVSYRGPSGFGFAYGSLGTTAPVEILHDNDGLPKDPRPFVGLGSRRLAILDVSPAGNQPMQIEGGDYSITFNGEIYNYKEIRAELEKLGNSLRTGTDTEVILRAYRQWGEECLRRFNGMWAFAIWDRPRQRLFCARDRFGVKPFYYALFNGAFYFGSEIKQILQASRMPRTANAEAVHHYLEWGLLDYSPETFFEGIHQLPAGHWLQLDEFDPLRPVIRRYWDLRIEPQVEIDEQEATERFRELFENAVRLRLRSDVPVGISLSGGLDSSAVVCQARRITPTTEFQTFSACFEDDSIDEREYVSAVVAATLGVGHVTVPEGASFWRNFKSIVYHQDEPPLSTGSFPQWCVMAEAHRHGVPVILGGQGGDEVLCGYLKYQYFYLWHLLRRHDPRFFLEAAFSVRTATNFHWTMDSAARYLPAVFRRSFSVVNRLGSPALRDLFGDTKPGMGAARSIAERQKIDLTYSSIPALLHHEDRISMAHSVESRLPFLDYQLVEFAVNCPPALKLRHGWSKWLLRNAMTDVLPEKIRLRRSKLGFDTPDRDWIRLGLQNGHRMLWESARLKMERFLDGQKFALECSRFLGDAPGALASGALFRAIALEVWSQVHDVD